MRKLNQKGFSLVEGLLVVIASALVVFVGYYVWHVQSDTNKDLNQVSQATQKAALETKKTSAKKEPNLASAVLYQDDTGATLYRISLLASTSDQKSLATAVDGYCKTKAGSADSVGGTGVADFFTNGQRATIMGTSAYLNMTCYDKTSKEAPWGYFDLYNFSKQDGSWKFTSVGQQ